MSRSTITLTLERDRKYLEVDIEVTTSASREYYGQDADGNRGEWRWEREIQGWKVKVVNNREPTLNEIAWIESTLTDDDIWNALNEQADDEPDGPDLDDKHD